MSKIKTGKRIYSLDIVRICATLGIILFHWFSLAAGGKYGGIWTANIGGIAGALVTAFFILSGFLLHGKWSDMDTEHRTGKYFKSRFLAILPMYYVAFVIASIPRILVGRGAVAPKWTILLTFTGLDSWLGETFPTYRVVGEWFIGAIIILYLLYPLLNHLYRKNMDVVMLVMTVLMILFRNEHLINPDSFHSILSCLFSFTVGAWLSVHNPSDHKVIGFISVLAFIVLTIIHLPATWNINLYYHVCGIFLFLALNFIGTLLTPCIENHRQCSDIIKKLSGLSYPVFLIHHAVILAVIQFINPQSFSAVILWLIIDLIATIILALFIQKITAFLLKAISGIFHSNARA